MGQGKDELSSGVDLTVLFWFEEAVGAVPSGAA